MPGFRLVGYRFGASGNGNGIVYAVPADVTAMLPEASLTDPDSLWFPPVPEGSLPTVMGAVAGDGSPASYLEASILAREFAEFGARWHGCSWVTHTVLDADPFQIASESRHSIAANGFPNMTKDTALWVWKTKRPEAWAPSVEFSEDPVVVTFHTFSALEGERLIRVRDKYQGGSYKATTSTRVLAAGPGGFVF